MQIQSSVHAIKKKAGREHIVSCRGLITVNVAAGEGEPDAAHAEDGAEAGERRQQKTMIIRGK